jgi:hypothetical protein
MLPMMVHRQGYVAAYLSRNTASLHGNETHTRTDTRDTPQTFFPDFRTFFLSLARSRFSAKIKRGGEDWDGQPRYVGAMRFPRSERVRRAWHGRPTRQQCREGRPMPKRKPGNRRVREVKERSEGNWDKRFLS